MVLINHYLVLTSGCSVVTIDYLVLINHYLVVSSDYLVVSIESRILDP